MTSELTAVASALPPIFAASFQGRSLFALSRTLWDVKFGTLPSGGKEILFSELKSALQKFLRRSMNCEFLSLLVFTFSALSAAASVDEGFNRYIRGLRNRLTTMCGEEGCFKFRKPESFERIAGLYRACEDSQEIHDVIVTSLRLAQEMTRSPVRIRLSSWYMCLVEKNLAAFPPIKGNGVDGAFKDLFKRLKLVHQCSEKKRGLDIATAYLVVVTRKAFPAGFEDEKDVTAIESSFKFYEDLDEKGLIESIGIRDKHTRNAKKDHRTNTFFAEVSAHCVCKEEYMCAINKLSLVFPSSRQAWSASEMKKVYDEEKSRQDNLKAGTKRSSEGEEPPAKKAPVTHASKRKVMDDSHPLGFKTLTMKVWSGMIGPLMSLRFVFCGVRRLFISAPDLTEIEKWLEVEDELEKDDGVAQWKEFIENVYKREGRGFIDEWGASHLKEQLEMYGEVPYKVLDDPLTWVKAFVNRLEAQDVVFDSLVKEEPLHLKHVESRACVEVQRLAKVVGVCCADVHHVLELHESQREQYIQQLESYLTACAAEAKQTERFRPAWAERTLRVTKSKFAKETEGQVFVLSEYIEMTQLVTLLGQCKERDALSTSLGEDFLNSKIFRTSWTTQMILNFVLPLNENNTSNYGVDHNGFVVRFDFGECDSTEELHARTQLNGLNTHGKSIVRELVEVFELGLQELGADGVYDLIKSTQAKLLRERSCGGGWSARADSWLTFFSSTPLGFIFVNGGSGATLLQMIKAYLQKDLALVPDRLVRYTILSSRKQY